MKEKAVKSKDTDKVLYILQELARMEGVTPTEWLTIRIMKAAKKKGLTAKPSKPKHITTEKPQSVSIDEFVSED